VYCVNRIFGEIFRFKFGNSGVRNIPNTQTSKFPKFISSFHVFFRKKQLFSSSIPHCLQAFQCLTYDFSKKINQQKVTFLQHPTYSYVIVIHSIIIGTCQKVSPLFPLMGAFLTPNDDNAISALAGEDS
jgi:hypothetical protein